MKLLSINVGRPRLVQHQGQTVSTAIYKSPIEGRVAVGATGVAGDEQADKRVHGGIDMAVYAYTADSYRWWREQLATDDLPPGTFGENLTIDGATDEQVQVGDRFRIGNAVLEVTQPRTPCAKLGIRMGDASFVKRFHQAERPGFYLRVIESGEIGAGDAIELVSQPGDSMDTTSMSIVDLYCVRFASPPNRDRLRQAAALPALSQAWRDDIERLMGTLG